MYSVKTINTYWEDILVIDTKRMSKSQIHKLLEDMVNVDIKVWVSHIYCSGGGDTK